ncbi:hypothetical protein HZB05_00665 [Candidatus Wolfebacteria bacterium]|nr:hypothetical protein [Candidatus Wolfebacteria bacterium]
MNKSDKEKQKLQIFGLLMAVMGIIIFYGACAYRLITLEMFSGFAMFGLGMALVGIQIFFKNKK